MGLMHRESFPVNGVFCAQPRKFSPSKVLPYTVLLSLFNVLVNWSSELRLRVFIGTEYSRHVVYCGVVYHNRVLMIW